MKKTLLGLALVAAAAMPSTASADGGKVSFKGDMKNVGDTLIVVIPSESNQSKMDTVLVKDGKFAFNVDVAEPMTIYVATPGTMRQQERVMLRLMAVPGESGEITGDAHSNYYVSGSKFYKEYDEADRAIEAAGKPLQDYVAGLESRLAAGESRDAIMKEYQEKAPQLQNQVTEGTMQFIKTHPGYEASAVFATEFDDLAKIKEAVAALSPEVREGRMKPYYQKIIDQKEEEAKAEEAAAAKQAAGVEAPDFTLDDINGKPFSLSSLRGKYVVLDFWGSWCIWCIRGIPQMKAYYEKYKGKFEILGIDCNDPVDKWKEAVKKHELPWLHVYNPRDSKVLADYAIQGFPTKVIVGPDGKIVKTVVGEDPEFYTFLDELFGK